ncbi:Peptidoglycan-binding LysM (fragment) [Candidatus Nitrosacidococcus tergens]|uniref:Peptidoglycan-binding LysM n=2 Tax=Candidatus Nitrosacidococcus tergens TaxID=553981 RepID=A0A7G1QBB8_9GAMM
MYALVFTVWRNPTLAEETTSEHPPLPIHKISPQSRSLELYSSISTESLKSLRQSLLHHKIVSKSTIIHAPYIISGSREHLISSTGDEIYAQNVQSTNIRNYGIYRKGEIYLNPDDPDEILGYQAIYIASARIKQFGDTAILSVLNTREEILVGDYLLPISNEFNDLSPHQLSIPLEGKIIAIVGGISQVDEHQVLVLNLGLKDGIDPGTVLSVYQRGDIVYDIYHSPPEQNRIKLPNKYAGEMIVFRTFNHISYGLILRTELPINIYDIVRTL